MCEGCHEWHFGRGLHGGLVAHTLSVLVPVRHTCSSDSGSGEADFIVRQMHPEELYLFQSPKDDSVLLYPAFMLWCFFNISH